MDLLWVYCCEIREEREKLRQELEDVKRNWSENWIFGGDFNMV